MKNKPTFNVGDSVMSSLGSTDRELMKSCWRAVVTERKPTGRPHYDTDGYCYVTVGYWDHKSRTKRPTSRQLADIHLNTDTSTNRVVSV